MSIGSKVSGDFKAASNIYAKVNGGWKKGSFGYIKVNGDWKQFWAEKLEDSFDRTDTTSTLGVAPSGQAWTIARSTWRISANNATTAGAKTDYPLAYVDLGFSEGTLQANELTPGTGIAFRVIDANNWYAVVPYYNQTATTYSYCAAYGSPYQVCTCSQTVQTGTGCNGTRVNQTCQTEVYCPGGYIDQTTPGYFETYSGQPCSMVAGEPVITTKEVCTNECIKECNRTTCTTQVVTPAKAGYYVWVGSSRIYVPAQPAVTKEVCTTTRICCDRDLVCRNVTTTTYPQVYQCTSYTRYVEPYTSQTCPGGTDVRDVNCVGGYCDGTEYPIYTTTCPCNQYTTQRDCVQSATGTTYTNYYYVRVIQMSGGVATVLSDTQVSARWNAIKATLDGPTLSVTAYSDSTYTTVVGTASQSIAGAGTGFGVASSASNFEDGRTIGSLLITPKGQ
jgi:hypothetical protein